MALRPDQRLYFAHVPKTAGTTLIPLLDARFDEADICPAQLWRELVRLPLDELPRYRLFRGHFGGHGLDPFLPEPPAKITFLRRPLALSRSTYLHVLREPNTRIHDLVMRRQMTLADFAQHPKTRRKISDKLVRNLSFDLQHDPDAGPILLSDESLQAVDRWVRRHEVPLDDDQRLERALTTLRGCAAFGLTERFDESMALLSFTFGWPAVGAVQKLRVATDRPPEDELDEALVQRIHALNPLDTVLYAEGERLFEQRLSAMVTALNALAGPGEQLPPRPGDAPELLTRLLDRHHARARDAEAAPPREGTRLDFARPLPGRGWHRRERVASDDSVFRWTGPGTESLVDLPRPASPGADGTADGTADGPAVLRLAVLNALADDVLDSLRVEADGRPVPLTLVGRAGPTVRLLQGPLPAPADDAGSTVRVVLRVARTVSPRSLDPASPDERALGVAVHWIELRAAAAADTGAPADITPDGSAVATAADDRASLTRVGREVALQRLKRRVAALPLVGKPLRRLRERRRRP